MNDQSKKIAKNICQYGKDILLSSKVQKEKNIKQHGKTNIYDHAVYVAATSLAIADKLHCPVNKESLVRGALLHDCFLYDWKIPDTRHKLHGFTHAKYALDNSMRFFKLNYVEKDIIKKHMFPLNITPPAYRESYIVCLADKICAVYEAVFPVPKFLSDVQNILKTELKEDNIFV